MGVGVRICCCQQVVQFEGVGNGMKRCVIFIGFRCYRIWGFSFEICMVNLQYFLEIIILLGSLVMSSEGNYIVEVIFFGFLEICVVYDGFGEQCYFYI